MQHDTLQYTDLLLESPWVQNNNSFVPMLHPSLSDSVLQIGKAMEINNISMLVVDTDHHILYVNMLFYNTFFRILSDGKRINNHLLMALINKSIAETEVKNEEIKLNVSATETLYLNIQALYNAQNKTITLYIKNSSKEALLQNDLDKERIKTEHHQKLKSFFLANFPHEIRTPMNAIIGLSELLTAGEVSLHEQNEYVRLIKNSGYALLRMVEDMLEMSLVQHNRIEIQKGDFDVNRVLSELYSDYEVRLEESGKQNVRLKKTCQHEPLMIYSDPVRLKQIFDKLLDNAVKFTFDGEIEFGYRLSVDNQQTIEFFVRDTGVGMLPEKQHTVFDSFTKVTTNNRIAAGMGLGLTIVQVMIQKLGGSLSIQSAIGQGSTFTFVLSY